MPRDQCQWLIYSRSDGFTVEQCQHRARWAVSIYISAGPERDTMRRVFCDEHRALGLVAPEGYDSARVAVEPLDESTGPAVLLDRIQELGDERRRVLNHGDDVTDELRTVCRQAIGEGLPKTRVARAAGITRATLDAWLTEGGK